MHFLFFLLALVVPWLLGFSMVQLFLRRRHGFLAFSAGVSYVLGWFISTLILRIYNYLGWQFDIYEIVIIECIIIVPFLFFRAAELLPDEVRVDRPTSKWVWSLSGIIICLLLYRWGLTIVDLISKPVFPWDGWMSWSAKAKIFYYYQEIPVFARGDAPFWWLSETNRVAVNSARHPDFLSLVQTYVAMAWGRWEDGVINLPWVGLVISMMLTVFGGLRYLGVGILPAMLAGYMVISLPIIDSHSSLGSYADLWVGAIFLISTSLLVVSLTYKEWRLMMLFIPFLIIIYLTKNTALVFELVFVIALMWWLFGRWAVSLLLMGLPIVLYFSGDWLLAKLKPYLDSVLSSGVPDSLFHYNPVAGKVFNEWFILDNWHYIFLATIIGGGMVMLGKERGNRGFDLLVVVIAGLLWIMLGLTFFTEKMSDITFTAYFNRVSLYFIPIFGFCIVGGCRITESMKE